MCFAEKSLCSYTLSFIVQVEMDWFSLEAGIGMIVAWNRSPKLYCIKDHGLPGTILPDV